MQFSDEVYDMYRRRLDSGLANAGLQGSRPGMMGGVKSGGYLMNMQKPMRGIPPSRFKIDPRYLLGIDHLNGGSAEEYRAFLKANHMRSSKKASKLYKEYLKQKKKTGLLPIRPRVIEDDDDIVDIINNPLLSPLEQQIANIRGKYGHAPYPALPGIIASDYLKPIKTRRKIPNKRKMSKEQKEKLISQLQDPSVANKRKQSLQEYRDFYDIYKLRGWDRDSINCKWHQLTKTRSKPICSTYNYP